MELKVVTYNVHFGLRIDEVTENIRTLALQGVALFCLQEARQFDPRPADPDVIRNALGSGWQCETFLRPNSHDLGLCLLWRSDVLRLVHIERILLPKLEKFNFYENIVEKKIIRLVTEPVQRGALVATFKMGSKTLRVTNLHLDCHGHFAQRAKQLNYLLSRLGDATPDYDVIAGDFNTIGPEILTHNQERKIHALLGPDFTNAYPHATPTHKGFLQRLDYVFVRNIKVNRVETLKMEGSDHYPLLVSLEVP